ncbi:MAG: ammonium transporter [Bacilli bacterium]|nr:ammonium transporter [Bacilli bacterium]
MSIEEVTQLTSSVGFSIWFLIGAALVFFMQAGFAMVETGFTRAKNAGNIIMKNLMDFCIGTVAFVVLGAGLMLGEDALGGFIGIPTLGIFTDFANFDWSNFVFNLVFCATAATIVSGAMAERTKFSTYCVYSLIISLVIYPVEAHWVWGGGWLSQLGFIDFAGSAAIHSVGGIVALIGAIMEGPRLGKYVKDENGKVTKVNAIQGHSITLGALGCFILWFGWYGFNGAAASSLPELGQIFATTTVAPAVATVVTLLFTWFKNGKPDVSMCLNAGLAGLVGITAGCQAVDIIGATIIGTVSGFLVVIVVEGLDTKLHIDDPVGAVGVHLANGIWGTIAAGLFATSSSAAGVDGPIYALIHGTSFGDGMAVLGIQFLGIIAILAWAGLTMFGVFKLLDKTIGLRVSKEEEIKGLDVTEHGLMSAYADFVPAVEHIDYGAEAVEVLGDVPPAEAIEVKKIESVDRPVKDKALITKIEIVCNEAKLEKLKNSLMDIGITGMTVSHVMGCGIQKGKAEYYRGVKVEATLLPKIQVDVVVSTVPPSEVIAAARKALYTGHVGDGKIFVYEVLDVVKVRTGESGKDALVNFSI